jgi:3-oxoacyl-[acyl-carrier protein] reductase
MSRLTGSTALVTGAAQGIGQAIARKLATEGARVSLADINVSLLEVTRKEFLEKGFDVLAFEVDVTNAESVDKMFTQAQEKMGRLDILVNNAGITRDNLIIRIKDEDWNKVLAVNLTGVFYCCRAASKIMLRQRAGKIINISSVVGLMGNAGQTNYSATKAGVLGITKTLARELASRNITVNAIAPGFIDTEMTARLPSEVKEKLLTQIPAGRLGLPEEVAEAVLFLASPAANYINGQVLAVDGGLTMQ